MMTPSTERKTFRRARGERRLTVIKRVPQLLAALLTVASLSSAAAPAHAALLPSCAVQLSDLRRGYVMGGAGYSPVDLAALQYYVSSAPYNADSALVSYLSSFYFPGWPTAREVEDSISLYSSEPRALAAFRQNILLTERWHRTWSYADRTGHHTVQEQWHALGAAGLGDQSVAWTTETQDAQHTYSVVFLLFRQGLYLASIRIFGPTHTFSLAQAAPLARLIDRRILQSCAVS